MTQTIDPVNSGSQRCGGPFHDSEIDPVRLKVAAERLERVLKQYPGSDDVLGLLHALEPLIDAAKAMDLSSPMGRADIPGTYNIADGVYRSYDDPDVEEAFVAFSIELRGG